MKHYVEINTSSPEALGEAYTKAHCLIAKSEGIGVSFPGYRYDVIAGKGEVGSTLRLFSQDSEVLGAIAGGEIKDIDGVEVSEVLPVPRKVKGHAIFQRQQARMNNSRIQRIAKRMVDRGEAASVENALEALQLRRDVSSLPMVHLESLSTKQRFPLNISSRRVSSKVVGNFTSYGLSHGRLLASVPLF